MPVVVRRGTFLYDGAEFQAQLDESKPRDAFPRYDVSTLRSIATPGGGDSATGASGGGSKPRDRGPGFYRAQLAHYGLKDFKTRDAAKKALLRAIEGSDKLVVPSHISQIERELREEWQEQNEIAQEEAYLARERAMEERIAEVDRIIDGNRALIKEIKRIKIPDSARNTTLDLKTLCRRYEVFAYEMEDYNIRPDESTLQLSLSDGGSHLWGVFEFGPTDGWFRSKKLASTQIKPGDKVVGYWRTENPKGDDEECMSPDNTFQIMFLGDGKIRGHIQASYLGTFVFVGRESKTQQSQSRKPMWEWKEHWKDVGDDALRARGGRKRAAPEANSDTEPEASSDFEADYDERELANDEEEDRKKWLARREAADELATKTFSEYDRNKNHKRAKGEKADNDVPSDLEGQYVILSQDLDNWEAPSDGRVLTFRLSRRKSHLWGRFDFGLYTGYVRSEALKSLPTSAGKTFSCHWRGEDAGSGEKVFDKEVNTMVITFLGDGKIRAEMGSESGTVNLVGTKRVSPSAKATEVAVEEWKKSWKTYSREAYVAAGGSRWGGGESGASREFNSDTDEEDEKAIPIGRGIHEATIL